MYEARVRPRQVLILVIIFGFMLYFVHKKGKNDCDALLQKTQKLQLNLPTIYAITPTYARPEQKAELTRLSHIFMLVPNLFWILVEDSTEKTELVKNLVIKSNLTKRSTILNIKTPDKFKLSKNDPNWVKPRGAEQRNLALEWIRNFVKPHDRGVVFFMDDDNTYSLELFEEMSKIEEGRVGVWPVGLVGGLKVEKPLLDANNIVVGFNAAWRPERPFPIDMAGFGISVDLLFRYKKALFSYEVQRGYQESEILRQITRSDDLQPLADLCTKILVWHTRTEKTNLKNEDKLNKINQKSDDNMEV